MNEWNDLIDAIRKDKPYNEVKRGVEASLVTSMGRMAAHTGREITYNDMLNCKHEFAPGVDTLTTDSPAPLKRRQGRQVPRSQPGHHQDTGVLSTAGRSLANRPGNTMGETPVTGEASWNAA